MTASKMAHMPDDRITELVTSLASALRDLVKVHHVTDSEWYAALAFLTEVGQADEFVLLSDIMGLSVLVDELTHADAEGTTPSNVPGPFWRPAPLLSNPAILVPEDEPGERLVLSGTVRTPSGTPVEGAELDFWQCDADGLYDVQVPGDEPRYRGRLFTGPDGRYELLTIVPPSYEIKKDGPGGQLLHRLGRHAWRPGHIHVRATPPSGEPLTTMLFINGDPWLGEDTIGAEKPSLVVSVDRRRSPAQATFDIIVGTADA